jgi:hypothetical protein
MSQHVLCSSIHLAPYEILEPGNAENPPQIFSRNDVS